MLQDNVHLSRRTLLVGLATCAAPALAAKHTSGDLAYWIERNSLARGGAARLARLESVAATVRIMEAAFTATGRYLAHRSGQMRIDVFADGQRVFSEGIDQAGAWSWPSEAAAPAPAQSRAREALEHGIVYNLVPLSAVASLGHELALVSGSPPCLQVNFSNGAEARLYLDVATGHIIRRQDRRAYHPDVDSTEKRLESRFSDFREQDGIVSPWLVEDYDLGSGTRIGRTETLRVAWDMPVLVQVPRDAPVQVPA